MPPSTSRHLGFSGLEQGLSHPVGAQPPWSSEKCGFQQWLSHSLGHSPHAVCASPTNAIKSYCLEDSAAENRGPLPSCTGTGLGGHSGRSSPDMSGTLHWVMWLPGHHMPKVAWWLDHRSGREGWAGVGGTGPAPRRLDLVFPLWGRAWLRCGQVHSAGPAWGSAAGSLSSLPANSRVPHPVLAPQAPSGLPQCQASLRAGS